MKTCDVKLTMGRTGPAGAQVRGQVVAVGLLEAGRMLRSGQIEKPDAKTLKAIAAAEVEAGKETATATTDKAAAEKEAAEKAAAEKEAAEKAAEGEG